MDKDFLIFIGTLPWVLFLFAVFFYNSKKGNAQKRLFILFWLVLIFASIRYGIGYDYYSYKYVIEGNGYDYQLERWEILPRFIASVCSKIHYQLFFAICSVLTIWPIYFVSKRLSTDPLKSFTVYLLFPLFFLDGLGVIRNAVAYSLVFLMYYCLSRKKYIQSIICLLFAVGFHISAVVAILIYPFYYWFHSKGVNVTLYVLSFVLSLFIMPLFEMVVPESMLYAKFLSNIEKEITAVGGTFFYVINGFAIFNLLCWKKLSSVHNNSRYLTLTNVGVCLWNVFLSIDPTTAQRLSTYFLFFIIFVIPSYVNISLRNRPFIRMVSMGILYVLFISSIGLNLYAYYEKGRPMSNVPYQVFFLNPSDAFYHIE